MITSEWQPLFDIVVQALVRRHGHRSSETELDTFQWAAARGGRVQRRKEEVKERGVKGI